MEITENEKAYWGGVLEGERCISLGKRQVYVTPTLQVTNTYLPLLEWCQARFSGGIYERMEYRIHRKHSWLWSVAGQKALSAIRAAYPYLLVKRRQAEIVLALPRYQPDRENGRFRTTMTDNDKLANQEAISLIRALNRRGQ